MVIGYLKSNQILVFVPLLLVSMLTKGILHEDTLVRYHLSLACILIAAGLVLLLNL